ncbi:Uncharacterised protein [uncultured archaeon]|nr:Uncharacterised protein [uncultured archaeon]
MGRHMRKPKEGANGQSGQEGRKQPDSAFAELDAHILRKIKEVEKRAREGGPAYEMAIKACNRSELSDRKLEPGEWGKATDLDVKKLRFIEDVLVEALQDADNRRN